jgi:hypothetical protein
MDLGSVYYCWELQTTTAGRDWSTERNYEQTKNFNKPLALASGSRPKLQAASHKLQASSRKLDKTAV